MEQWTRDRLEAMIRDAIEEKLTLEYKAAGSLGRQDSRKLEITKDVSAMANSAGGTLIYGIAEGQDTEREHLPEKLDPVDRALFSREWLEHVIGNIRPRIEGLQIFPVSIDESKGLVAYVVEIPQGRTAHQAQDLRYYMRRNFESVPMADHEIRDVMARGQHAKLEVSLSLSVGEYGFLELWLHYHNTGSVYARYVNGVVRVPMVLMHSGARETYPVAIIDGDEYAEVDFANIHKDLVAWSKSVPSVPYYVTRYDPILPGLGRNFRVGLAITKKDLNKHKGLSVLWVMFVDNAGPQDGLATLEEIAASMETDPA